MSDYPGANLPPEPPVPPPPMPPSGSGEPTPADSNRTVMLVLSYLGILALIPFFVEQNDKEVRWHAKHGIVLTAIEIAIWVALTIISMSGIGAFLSCAVIPFFGLGVLVLHIMCILKAIKGERLVIPGLSELADKF